MKILAIGDFHGSLPKKFYQEIVNADLVLCTGDFGGSDRLLKVIFSHFHDKWWKIIGHKKAKEYVMEDYNSGLKVISKLNSFNKPIYVIPGNWDFITKSEFERTASLDLEMYPSLIRRKFKNLKWWNRGMKKVDGLKILAFGGPVTAGAYLDKGVLSDKRRKRSIKRNNKEVKQIMSYGEKNIDILFAHYTPYKYFDKVRFKGHNPMNGKHVGFKGYTEFIKKYQPQFFIAGHMHEYQGVKKLGKTLIIATGPSEHGQAVLIDYPKGSKGKIKVKFIK